MKLLHPEDINNPREYYKYWPDHDGLYDNVLVKCISSTMYDGFIVRQFRAGPVEVRSLLGIVTSRTHFHIIHLVKP